MGSPPPRVSPSQLYLGAETWPSQSPPSWPGCLLCPHTGDRGGPVPCSGVARFPLPLLQPLSINGDKEFLEDLDGPGAFPLPPVIAVTLCPAHGEDAGPLPLKVDLDKTVL